MKLLCSVMLFFFNHTCFAQLLSNKLAFDFIKFKNDENLKHATISLTIFDINQKKIIYGFNEHIGVAPASTLKTITAATALHFLGDNYKYETIIAYTGNIENGILNGDLVITGSGDPTLGSWRWESTKKNIVLDKIYKALKVKGIKAITGKILVDDAVWDSQSLPTGWIWQDIGNYYGAATSALCWGENQTEISFKAGNNTDDPVAIKSNVEMYPFLNLINELKTGSKGTGDQVYAYSAPYTATIYLRGTYALDLDKKIGISLPDAALAFGYDLKMYLATNGIKIDSFNTTRNIKVSKSPFIKMIDNQLVTIQSPPLKEIIYWFNQKSINLYGEQLIRTLAAQHGKSTTIIEGINVLKDYWNTKQISKNSLNIVDGSGLSPGNRVTSFSIVQVLASAHAEPWFTTYYASLPVYNNMKMKSGSIADVIAYAGYQKNKEGNFCFSIIINNYTGSTTAIRQKIFNFLDTLK